MNIESLLQEIQEHEEVIATNREKAKEKQRKAANILCPFVVGERVINGRNEEEIISSISWAGMPGKFSVGYSFKVKKIKKNGEPYIDANYAFSPEKYTKAKQDA